MMADIEGFLERIFGHEGGYVNDPGDPGGETNWGISKRAHPKEDIRNLTRERAAEIYREQYWPKVRGDEVPEELQFDLFDGAINSGPENAIRWMQRAAGVADDGLFGPITLAAVKEANPWALTARYNGERLLFLTKLSTWKRFGRGWAARVAENLLMMED
jgi:lysozyme family protein